MIKKNLVLSIVLMIITTSCKYEKSEIEIQKEKRISLINKINKESGDTFKSALLIIKDSGYRVNTDSIKNEFEKTIKDSAELGLKYAKNLKEFAFDLHFKDSALHKKMFKVNHEKVIKENLEWDNSKAGKIQKNHPNWTKSLCIKLANGEIWIGMTLEMLIAQKGKPNISNPSNYGNGVKWQWCWSNSTPSCFYGKSDEIVTAYN